MPNQPAASLASHYRRPEYPIDHKMHKIGGIMIIPDRYYYISETPLRGRIQESKLQLHDMYIEMLLTNRYSIDDILASDKEKEASEGFYELYRSAVTLLNNQTPASEIEEHLRSSFFPEQAPSAKHTFPIAIMWIACSEFLEHSGFKEKAWPTLIEFHKMKTELENCASDNIKENKKKSNKEKKNKSMYENLKKSFIENIHNDAPPGGWKTKQNTAAILAPKVFEEHIESPNAQIYPITLEAVTTKLENWLRKSGDPGVLMAYNENSSKNKKS